MLSRKKERKKKKKKKRRRKKGESRGVVGLYIGCSSSIRRAFLCTLQPARRMRKEGERKKEGGSVDERDS